MEQLIINVRVLFILSPNPWQCRERKQPSFPVERVQMTWWRPPGLPAIVPGPDRSDGRISCGNWNWRSSESPLNVRLIWPWCTKLRTGNVSRRSWSPSGDRRSQVTRFSPCPIHGWSHIRWVCPGNLSIDGWWSSHVAQSVALIGRRCSYSIAHLIWSKLLPRCHQI